MISSFSIFERQETVFIPGHLRVLSSLTARLLRVACLARQMSSHTVCAYAPVGRGRAILLKQVDSLMSEEAGRDRARLWSRDGTWLCCNRVVEYHARSRAPPPSPAPCTAYPPAPSAVAAFGLRFASFMFGRAASSWNWRLTRSSGDRCRLAACVGRGGRTNQHVRDFLSLCRRKSGMYCQPSYNCAVCQHLGASTGTHMWYRTRYAL